MTKRNNESVIGHLILRPNMIFKKACNCWEIQNRHRDYPLIYILLFRIMLVA